jgi:two-component system nitrogen regulation sensor histidine kinase NtrY
MASSLRGAIPLAIGLAARGVIAGAALWAAAWLTIGQGAYMAALVLLACAAAAFADAIRLAGRGERRLRIFAEALASGTIERPAGHDVDQPLMRAIEKAAERIEADRHAGRMELDRLSALLDTVGTALYVLDTGGAIRFANRAAHQMTRSAADRFANIPAIGPALAPRLETLPPGAREMEVLADGRAVLVGVAAFRSSQDEGLRLISLQAIVGELDAVELKVWKDLSRVLAHEMMNSLVPIVSMTESLQAMLARPEPPNPVSLTRAVETIGRRSAGLMRFVDRYRRMAELPPPELQPVRLAELVADLAALVEPGFLARNIRLQSSVEPADLMLDGDAELLSQAILNLLKNAGEALDGRTDGLIRLTCRRDEADVTISVEDNGVGLQGDGDSIFLPFYTTRQGNDGIGLSIARQVALAHRGTIVAEPMYPGARFSLHLRGTAASAANEPASARQ